VPGPGALAVWNSFHSLWTGPRYGDVMIIGSLSHVPDFQTVENKDSTPF